MTFLKVGVTYIFNLFIYNKPYNLRRVTSSYAGFAGASCRCPRPKGHSHPLSCREASQDKQKLDTPTVVALEEHHALACCPIAILNLGGVHMLPVPGEELNKQNFSREKEGLLLQHLGSKWLQL